jgi:hypothetical protein
MFTMPNAQQAAGWGGETIRAGYSLDGAALSVYWTMLGKRRDLLCQGPNFLVFRRMAVPAGSTFALAALRM